MNVGLNPIRKRPRVLPEDLRRPLLAPRWTWNVDDLLEELEGLGTHSLRILP
jgi:hypothetical protein